MFKRIGLFGVRKRINQIIEYLNEEETVDIGPLLETIGARLDNAVTLFGIAFRSISNVNERLDKLEKRNTRLAALLTVRKMGSKIDSEAIVHAIEKIEELEERIVSLESAISLRSETEGIDEQPDQD